MSAWEPTPGGSPSALTTGDGGGWGWQGPPTPTRRACQDQEMESTDLTVAEADKDFLDCPICFLPLKPPIFQCSVGHVVCSRCCDKLKDLRECHLCGAAMAGGYQRCHGMEHAVDSIRAPCPHGCAARPPYNAREDHLLRECPHVACHCPAGAACGFVGSTAALLDHVSAAHAAWPVSTQRLRSGSSCFVALSDGFNFAVSDADDDRGRKHLFLLNVVRQPFSRAVSVVCIRPRAAAAVEIKFTLKCHWFDWSDPSLTHEQRTQFRVACSDLSDGPPRPIPT